MKFLVAVALAVFAFQCVQASSIADERSLHDTLVKAVKKVKAALQTAHDEAHDGIQKGIDAVEHAFATAEQEVNDALTEVISEIQQLEAEAAAQGVETVECTQAQSEKVYALRDETVAELHEIGTNTTQVMTKVQEDVDGVLQGFVDIADSVLVKFEDCKSILCQSKVIAEATGKFAEITLEVPGIVLNAITSATETSANGIKAVTKVTGDYIITVKNILDEVSQCIQEKIEAA